MRLVVIDGIDRAAVADCVGPTTYQRGTAYARQRAVVRMDWDEEENVLYADVRGSGQSRYETVVAFRSRGDSLTYLSGECTCPVGVDCKHVVAAALTASGTITPVPPKPRPSSPAPSTPKSLPAPVPPKPRPQDNAWARSLDVLLEPARPGPRASTGTVPLAVELSVGSSVSRRGGPSVVSTLSARLVKPGHNGWVAGGMTWGRLDQPHHFAGCRPDHVRLLRELYALHQVHMEPRAYYYGSREDKTIDLAVFDSPRLWSLLDEAAGIGLEFVHTRKRLGSIGPIGEAELRLDVVAAPDGGLVVAPALHVDPEPPEVGQVALLMFVGASGQGVVYAPGGRNPAEHGFALARLANPVPPAVQRMALAGQRLVVPDAQQDRFRAEFYPRLSRLAPVVSSDGAFEPPAVSAPTLVLHAAYGAGHDLALNWEWTYDVDDTTVRMPVSEPGADDVVRDPAAERAVLESVRDLGVEVPEKLPFAHSALRGVDTMRFTTEVLPLLAGLPGVAVERVGEPREYREAGDSLQVGVSTRAVTGETDWFDLGVRISVEGRQVPFADVFVALAGGESHLLLPDGAYFALDKPELRSLRALIEEARALQDTVGGPLRISRFQAGLWDELAALGVVDRQARAWREQVTGLLSLDGMSGTDLPATLTAELRPYQREGFDWLCFLWRHRLGGVLADDMGLGKTLQALALICHAKQTDPAAAPFLIVAPTSVVSNWAAEAARFAPGLAVVTVTDTLRRRGQDLDQVVAGADVVVTSYTLFRLDIDAYAAAEWSGLVLDEAQFTKNHQSKVHQCARRLPAPFKLAITGTPMENNLMELWSLLSITAPGLFPSPTRFRDTYARPIEQQSDAEGLARLRRRIRPLVKRRTKEQVAPELPAKQEHVLEVELDPRHRRLYQRHLQRERQKVLGLLDDVDRNRFTILRSITLLRQLSLHPGLIDPEQAQLGSAKVDALLEQLGEVVGGGHRALVFSQFTGFLAHVRERLDEAGIGYAYLDGSSRDRGRIVDRFTGGEVPVFLISLKAGGFGLNLTEADYCFLLDPWWNPATEAQAIDRTHRIGQTRNVMVYRLIARDTIEEKVLALATRKAALFAGVMNDGNAFGSALDADDIRALIS